jgi:hypothetical protein
LTSEDLVRPTILLTGWARAICCTCLTVLAGPARAEDEFVPELNAFVRLTSQTRLFLYAAATRFSGSHALDGELGAHVDLTLKPIVRTGLRDANWERDRYLWVRLGYVRLDNLEGKEDATVENRVVMEVTARAGLPLGLWIVNRVRIDFRDLGGDHSNRYRYRIGAEREFLSSSGTALVPYAQAESFYDTRFDSWSRRLYQVGAEIELNKSWRMEPYYAYEKDTKPTRDSRNRVGPVLKYFH